MFTSAFTTWKVAADSIFVFTFNLQLSRIGWITSVGGVGALGLTTSSHVQSSMLFHWKRGLWWINFHLFIQSGWREIFPCNHSSQLLTYAELKILSTSFNWLRNAELKGKLYWRLREKVKHERRGKKRKALRLVENSILMLDAESWVKSWISRRDVEAMVDSFWKWRRSKRKRLLARRREAFAIIVVSSTFFILSFQKVFAFSSFIHGHQWFMLNILTSM